MIEKKELEFEDKLISYLENLSGTKQWEYVEEINTTDGLWANFKKILEQNNSDILTEPLSDSEFSQVRNAINKINTPYDAGKFLYGLNGVSQVEVNLDDGRHVYLTIFDQDQSGGTGKTVLAKMIAQNVVKDEYYLSGSDKDYFQNYDGEHCVILDEFRPDKISYSDLLKMLDNSRFDVNAPARYHDKKILADLIIITSPYDSARYYQNDESIRPAVDGFEQLERRITMALYVEKDKISLMKYAGYRTEKISAPGSGNFKRERPYYKAEASFENYISAIKNSKNYKKEENKITPKILEKLHFFEEKFDKNIGLKLERKK